MNIKVDESYVDALVKNAAWDTAKVKLDEALTPGQKKLDKDGDGKIEGEDLAKLRKKKDDKKKKIDAMAMKEEAEGHTCPLCEQSLEEELSDERIYEHINDIMETLESLEEAAMADDDDEGDDADKMAMKEKKKKKVKEMAMKNNKDDMDEEDEDEKEVKEAMDPDEMAMKKTREMMEKKKKKAMKKIMAMKKDMQMKKKNEG